MIVEQFGIFASWTNSAIMFVYKAIDVHLDRPVAIKMLNTDLARNPELVERFRSEAKLRPISITSISPLSTLFSWKRAMPSCHGVRRGRRLSIRMIRNRALFPGGRRALVQSRPFSDRLRSSNGIIHRDISPEHICATPRHRKVMDFGIAKVVGMRGVTRTGMLLALLFTCLPSRSRIRQVTFAATSTRGDHPLSS